MPLIQLEEYPVRLVLDSLLKDKTTKRNILFATDAANPGQPMTPEILLELVPHMIQPRVCKDPGQRADRTRKRAEVFTPSWICNKMNNDCDAEWFGREDVFNAQDGQDWTPTAGPILFPRGKSWRDYVDSRRLEITCGEAPYLVSRYDSATGEAIELERRIGILDRKLRVVGENAESECEWLKWAYRACESVYGYELQGDSLLIARINVLVSFVDYMRARWGRVPIKSELRKAANIISWNLWQMDGLTAKSPIIYDWRARRPVAYGSAGNI